jgi:hypothetical protein
VPGDRVTLGGVCGQHGHSRVGRRTRVGVRGHCLRLGSRPPRRPDGGVHEIDVLLLGSRAQGPVDGGECDPQCDEESQAQDLGAVEAEPAQLVEVGGVGVPGGRRAHDGRHPAFGHGEPGGPRRRGDQLEQVVERGRVVPPEGGDVGDEPEVGQVPLAECGRGLRGRRLTEQQGDGLRGDAGGEPDAVDLGPQGSPSRTRSVAAERQERWNSPLRPPGSPRTPGPWRPGPEQRFRGRGTPRRTAGGADELR